LADQREARRQKNAVKKEKRVNRKLEAMGLIKKVDKPEGKKDEPVAAGKKVQEKKGGAAP